MKTSKRPELSCRSIRRRAATNRLPIDALEQLCLPFITRGVDGRIAAVDQMLSEAIASLARARSTLAQRRNVSESKVGSG